MKWIIHILIFWLLFARFLVNDDFSIAGNISALIIAMFLIRENKTLIVKITLLVTLSVFYTSLLQELNINLPILGVIGAILTTVIAFNPIIKWNK